MLWPVINCLPRIQSTSNFVFSSSESLSILIGRSPMYRSEKCFSSKIPEKKTVQSMKFTVSNTIRKYLGPMNRRLHFSNISFKFRLNYSPLKKTICDIGNASICFMNFLDFCSVEASQLTCFLLFVCGLTCCWLIFLFRETVSRNKRKRIAYLRDHRETTCSVPLLHKFLCNHKVLTIHIFGVVTVE